MSGQVTVFYALGGQLVRWQQPGGGGGGTTVTVPGVPSAVVGTSTTSTAAKLSWGPPAVTGGAPITGYVVSRSGGSPITLAATARSYSFGSLTASSTYTLSVAAINSAGTGAAVTKSVTTTAGTVTGARFPGDPNPLVNGGGLYWGESVLNNNSPSTQEAGTGTVVGNRHRYWSNISDLAVPSGPIANAVVDDHANNRLPLVSWHVPGANWAGAANGALDAQLDAWIAWCEARAKPIYWVVNHEPENGDGPAADFRAWMQQIRSRMTVYENAHGPLRRLVFCGCLMSWTFNPANGGPTAWWPGDGVWDVLGIDHYVDLASIPTPPSTTILTPLWYKVATFAAAHNAPIFVMEWGVRPSNPSGAQIMQDFYDYCTSGSVDVVGMSYFNVGSWWALTDNNGMLSKFRALLSASKSVHMSDLGY